MPRPTESSDSSKDRWLQGALEEYRSLRDESLKGLQAQQVGVQIGVTLLAALIGVGVKITDRLTGALLLDVAVPLLAIFLTILWQGELERSVRVGRYLKERERIISDVASLAPQPSSMGWETWLSRNPQLRLTRYYNAEFTVVGLLALASAVVGVVGLLGQRRWGMALVFGAGAAALLFAASLQYRTNHHRLMSIATTAPVGVVAFSFGNRRPGSGPSVSNLRLAEVVESLSESGHKPAVVVAQSEVAEHLAITEHENPRVIPPPSDGSYLDSGAVWRQARDIFRQAGITRVIAVAHPFLHLHYARRLIRHDGFYVIRLHLPPIGFDRSRENTQWWTRGRLRLIVYAVILPVARHSKHRSAHK